MSLHVTHGVHHIRCWVGKDDPTGRVAAGKYESEFFSLVEHIIALQSPLRPYVFGPKKFLLATP